MDKRIVLALLLSSTSAFAQDAEVPPPPSATPTTPTVVTAPDVDAAQVSPWIYRKGNLRLSIACADNDDGYAVSVDGQQVEPRRINGTWSTYTDSDGNDSNVWNASDTGYLLAPGRHHVQIDAQGCAPSAFDVDLLPDHAQHALGRLAVDDWSLQGPVGAPNGFGITLGAWLTPGPTGTSTNSTFNQTATYDASQTGTGGYLSFSHERRNLVIAGDIGFASAPVSGMVSGQSVFGNEPPQGFTGNAYMSQDQLRVGARLPLHDVALEAGSGVGLDWWVTSTTLTGSATSGLFAPDGIDGSMYLPLWAGATIKPTCDWGFQVTGQYDVHPTSMDTNGFEISGGILYQPSASCSESPGVQVSTN